MNSEIDKASQIIALIKEAKNIAIMPSKIAGVDAFAAGVGLYHMLKEENKSVTIIYPGVTPEEFGDLVGVEISSNAGQRELIVHVDYSDTDASKVNYSTENDVLRFSISPIGKDFDPSSRVRTEIKGFTFDLIITIWAQSVEDLGKTFTDLESEFIRADILNIDNTDMNQRFGNINVVDSNSQSLSLLILNNSVKWDLRLANRSAEALLKGIAYRKGI